MSRPSVSLYENRELTCFLLLSTGREHILSRPSRRAQGPIPLTSRTRNPCSLSFWNSRRPLVSLSSAYFFFLSPISIVAFSRPILRAITTCPFPILTIKTNAELSFFSKLWTRRSVGWERKDPVSSFPFRVLSPPPPSSPFKLIRCANFPDVISDPRPQPQKFSLPPLRRRVGSRRPRETPILEISTLSFNSLLPNWPSHTFQMQSELLCPRATHADHDSI